MASQTTARHEPFIAAESDTNALHEVARVLASASDDSVTLVLPDGRSLDLPESAVVALRFVVEAMSTNRAVVVSPVEQRLTPERAAHILNVSDEDFESILNEGDIPVTALGSLRQIALKDLLVYKHKRDETRRDALREMTRLSQEMGFYQPGETDPGIS
jgi:hypothetical protein